MGVHQGIDRQLATGHGPDDLLGGVDAAARGVDVEDDDRGPLSVCLLDAACDVGGEAKLDRARHWDAVHERLLGRGRDGLEGEKGRRQCKGPTRHCIPRVRVDLEVR
jgi:hypothetical protein